MHATQLKKLIEFLTQDLGVSSASIKTALKSCQQQQGPLPVILWQYGLISLEQLNEVFRWSETSLSTDDI